MIHSLHNKNTVYLTYTFNGGFHDTFKAIELIAVTLTSRGGPSVGVLLFIVEPSAELLSCPSLYSFEAYTINEYEVPGFRLVTTK